MINTLVFYKNISEELLSSLKLQQSTKYIKSKPPLLEEVMDVTSSLPSTTPISERVWLIKNDMQYPPPCENGSSKKWVDGNVGYRFCGRATTCECARANHSQKISAAKASMDSEQILSSNERRRKTVLEKYGVEHIAQSSSFRLAVETTSIARYGHKTSLMSEEVKSKIKETNNRIYGFDVPTQNAEVKDKILKTKKDRYGDNHSIFSRREEFSKKMIELYGVEHALQNDNLRKKRSDTNLRNWGFENHMQNIDLVKKMKDTTQTRYGYPHKSQANYEEYDLHLVNDPDFFETEYVRLGVSGLIDQYNVSRAVIRNCLIKFNIAHDKNLTFPEKIIENILDDLGVDYIVRNRSIIPPLELDFYISDKKIAIEVCGLYWHSEELGKDRSYHLNKFKRCKELGIRLITIFDDELKNSDLVRRKISHILCAKIDKICGARKTVIKEISSVDARSFLDSNHVQGYCKSSVRIGAFYNNTLVAVMTFGSLRKALGNSAKKDQWEILRMATSGNIPGIASKMFSYFKKEKKPIKVISYCDLRWGTGNVYTAMGFSFSHNTTPGYWYLNKACTERMHRYNFTKSKLVSLGYDSTLSESQIMKSIGHRRVWDCGHSLWIWDMAKYNTH